jgi:hypothetical protein
MEKFTKWRDPKTGFHPFLPPQAKEHENIVKKWGLIILLFPLVMIRALIFITLLVVLFIVDFFAMMVGYRIFDK